MVQKCTPLFKIATRQPHLPILGQCASLEMIAGVYLSSLAPMDKPSMDLNSLTAIGGHDRQFFDKLLWGLVTSTIFVRW
jgi:hypothetical protein